MHKTFDVDLIALSAGRIEIAASPTAKTQTLVSSGEPVLGMEVEIVDPTTRCRAAAGEIGEIYVANRSPRYWKQPRTDGKRRSTQRLLIPVKTAVADGRLGCKIDEQLIVTGRLKELIIIGGRNFYPHDIEATVQSVSEGFKPDSGTAFSDRTRSAGTVGGRAGGLAKKFLTDDLLPETLDAIAATYQVTPHAIVLVKAGSLPKTSSGKLRRSDCRQMFLDGELLRNVRWQNGDVQSAQQERRYEPPTTSTQRELALLWTELLQVKQVGLQDNFSSGWPIIVIGQLAAKVRTGFWNRPFANNFVCKRNAWSTSRRSRSDNGGSHVDQQLAIVDW
ncbi:MAG: hypothetical protein R3C05_21520 [Pirellulaceae bacterium]